MVCRIEYEIYDYIQSHPSLSFLNEAETIHPQYFQWLKAGIPPKTYALRALYVLLSFIEIMHAHGFANIAIHGTLANQYAYSAYYSWKVPSDFGKKFDHFTHQKNAREKSSRYLKEAGVFVPDILAGRLSSLDIPARDILVGLNQYASACRYLRAMGIAAEETADPDSVFDFTMNFSKSIVAELHHFTGLLNATTLNILPHSQTTAQKLRESLAPFFTFSLPKHNRRPGNIIDRVIDSRFAPDGTVNIYGRTNISRLAAHVPEFRDWLIANGWTEKDFANTSPQN
jgi:hypothetical protein